MEKNSSFGRDLWKATVKACVTCIIAYGGITLGINQISNNSSSSDFEGNHKKFSRATGPFSYESFTRKKSELENTETVRVGNIGLMKDSHYTDTSGDGLVDLVYFSRFGNSGMFRKDKHGEEFPELFEKANQVFSEVKSRLEDRLPEARKDTLARKYL